MINDKFCTNNYIFCIYSHIDIYQKSLKKERILIDDKYLKVNNIIMLVLKI